MLFIPLRFLVLPIAVLLLAGGFVLYKQWERKRDQQVSYLEWEIRKYLQSGDSKKVKDMIEEGLKKGGAFKPLIISYSLQVGTDKKESEIIQQLISNLKDEELRALYTERLAFAYVKEGQKEKALKVLESIEKKRFNHLSAQLLKAQILLDMEKKDEAKTTLSQAIKDSKSTYWSNIAKVLLKEIEG
ncbi:tetratricopeptide repeat protein [Thermocrinis sp.]|uniref:tetratricopeptide repeat protein n=1 Tax=Thermocrinis sp. TaxID=2024383 RepID=UPI002FDE39AE